MASSRRGVDRYVVGLLATLVVAAALRFFGLDWDAGQHQHPDERHISDVIASRIVVPPRNGLAGLLDPEHSDLNPRSDDPATGRPRPFAYGSLPLLVTDAVSCVLDQFSGHVCQPGQEGTSYWTSYEHQFLVGRALTVLVDLALIVVTFLLARRAFGPITGLAAAVFVAVSVVHIQLAHFFATDTWSAFFATAALWALYRAVDRTAASWRDWALAGILIGASVASKPNTLALGLPAALAVLGSAPGTTLEAWQARLRNGVVLGAATLLAFAVFEPYALWALDTYLLDFREQRDIIGGEADIPFTRQFTGTLPVWHYLWNLWGYGLGAGLTTLGLAGVAASVWRIWRWRSRVDMMLIAWVASYGLLINIVFAKFTRYTLPLVPVLAVLGGAVVAVLLDPRRRPALQQAAAWLLGRRLHSAAWPVLAALPLVLGLLQALTFVTIYTHTHTRVAASEWIYEHVPRGSHLTADTWDDALPLGLPDGRNTGSYRYQHVRVDLYTDRPPQAELDEIQRILRESDYIVLASQRIYGSTDRLPWRYAMVNRYYDLLFAERLGFTLVYENTLQPRLGPFHLDSRWADESFSVYDHPPVHIFQKQTELSRDQLEALFRLPMERQPVISRTPPEDKSLLVTEPLWTWPDLSHEEWAQPPGSSWGGLARWLLALGLLTVVGAPWALLLLSRLADLGAAFSRTLALLLVGYLVWLGSSLHWTVATSGLVLVVAVAVGALGWFQIGRRPDLGSQLREHWPAIALTELVFWGGFLNSLGLRLANPDLWQPWLGGEKPMEMAFLNAVLRSGYFPAYDPWFSGGYINYYYFGFLLVGVPIKLAGVAPAIAFNLAVPTLFGLVASSACAIGQTLGRHLAATSGKPGTTAVASATGLAAAVLTVGIGNLDGALQVIQRATGQLDSFDFWQSSRVVQFAITEFPYFSFLFADLHAHVIAMPLALLVIGAALALVIGKPVPVLQPGWRQAPWALIGIAALVLGALAATNAWDVPAYAAVTAAAVFLAAPFRRRSIIQRALWAGGVTALTLAAAYLLYLPFFQAFQSFYGSLGISRIPTQLHELVTMWGYQLALCAVLLAVLVACCVPRASLERPRWWVALAVLVTAIATGAMLSQGRWVPALVLPLIGAFIILWLLADLPPAGEFMLVLLIGAWAIIAGVEFIFIVDFLQGGDWYRMNTMFKLYLEAWLLLALGLAGGLALIVRHLRRLHPVLQGFVATVVAVGLLASLAYPLLVTPDRLAERFEQQPGPTLNGMAYMEVGTLRDPAGATIHFDDDLALIYWLMGHANGLPVVAEASIGPYRGNGSRIANSTGLPTILGWDNHESQQRWPEAIPRRVQDVRTIYTSGSPLRTMALLEQYDVDYIVVGEVERYTTLRRGQLGAQRDNEPYASPEGLATLARLAELGVLEPAFQQGETILYHVVRPLSFRDLSAALGSEPAPPLPGRSQHA